ncbi:hypothetical protein T265_02893, partial [Opisthorchis viverrini]
CPMAMEAMRRSLQVSSRLDCQKERTISAPKYHVTIRKHERLDTARLSKPTQGKSIGRDRVRTTGLPVS